MSFSSLSLIDSAEPLDVIGETLGSAKPRLKNTALVGHFVFHDMFSYGRRNVVALGKFALNLCGFPRERGSDLVAQLCGLLSTFVTKVC